MPKGRKGKVKIKQLFRHRAHPMMEPRETVEVRAAASLRAQCLSL